MIWALFTLMLGAAAAFVAAPLLTRRCASARQGVRADVFRRQLAEIEAELETGVIAEPEAAALR
ncbi:MAG: c-type cytochrome biogenesis protein CcmI, partial [Parvularculaceae bacterium]|nr:c-type cytochrome biogenesis protein CcmI [Parvularculaceae bacterium]